MSSSTSSSNREWRVVLFLVVSFLTVEGIIRLIEPKLSRDLAQIRNTPNVAEELRNHQGTKVLVLIILYFAPERSSEFIYFQF